MKETPNEIDNEELQQFAEDLCSSFEQIKEAIKVLWSELKEALDDLMPPLVDYAEEVERIKHNNHTRQSWVVSYDMTRASQVVNRRPKFTRVKMNM